MIKNIVFDLGHVLIQFPWRECMKKAGIKEEDIERVASATVNSPYWGENDRGVIRDDELLEKFISLAPDKAKEITDFVNTITEFMGPFDYSYSWLKSLKDRGYNIYILSNFSDTNFNKLKPSYTFLELADGMVISYLYKCVKPEREIYDLLLNKYSLTAEECVFIDDREDNIEAALSRGMYGIVFKSYDDANGKLQTLLSEKGIFG